MNLDTKGKFDAEVCENIPLHNTNFVQSYGFLLVTDYDLKVIQWSDQLPSFLGIRDEELENQDLKEFLVVQQYQEIRKKIADKKVQDHIPMDLIFSTIHNTVQFKALLHIKEEYLILELEETQANPILPFAKLYQEIKYISAILKVTGDVDDLSQKAAENLRALSGFDRIMIYCFDDEWNGQVIGEASKDDMVKYMGFHFPSSDIPKQARQLYLKNPYRMIPDTLSTTHALVPNKNRANNGYTDLSDCNLRSVAQVHIEYLKNMGIQASMSVPIIKDQKLWGLIACHHQTAKQLTYEMRSAFELLATLISEQISSRHTQKQLERRVLLFTQLGKLVQTMSESQDFVKDLLEGKGNLLSLMNLSGAIVLYENNYVVQGEIPPRDFVEKLMEWHKKEHTHYLYYSHNLPLEYEPAKAFSDIASGVIFLPLAMERNYYIVGFRKEYIQTIQWAGNPEHAQSLPNDVNALHPRNSFSIFRETKRYHSKKWDNIEVEVADTLLKATLEIILKSQIMNRMIAEEQVYQLSVVAQKTANSVITLDRYGNVEWMNDSFSTLAGQRLKDVVGKTLNEVLKSSGNIEEVSQMLGMLHDQKGDFNRDILIKKDGKDFYLNFNFSRVPNGHDDKEKFIAVGTDFTAIKEKSMALEAINEQLDKYTYIVSHDLKAPLKGLEGLLNIVEENNEQKDYDDNIHIFPLMREALTRMDGFISSLLVQAKGQNTEAEEVNLNQLIQDVTKWLQPDPYKIKVLIQKDLPTVKTNRTYLQQIFSNLFSNAIRYGQPVEGICLIEVGLEKKDTPFLHFYVKDNGQGIAKEFHQRIFHLYDTGKEKGSTGIGLYTLKSIVEENGGKIWVESELGQGANFHFTWKLSL